MEWIMIKVRVGQETFCKWGCSSLHSPVGMRLQAADSISGQSYFPFRKGQVFWQLSCGTDWRPSGLSCSAHLGVQPSFSSSTFRGHGPPLNAAVPRNLSLALLVVTLTLRNRVAHVRKRDQS